MTPVHSFTPAYHGSIESVPKMFHVAVLRALIASAEIRQTHYEAMIEDDIFTAEATRRMHLGQARILALKAQLSSLT